MRTRAKTLTLGVGFLQLVLVLSLIAPARAAESLDPSFGEAGLVRPGTSAALLSLTEDSSGRVVGAGTTAGSFFLTARFLGDGQRDPSFGNGRGGVLGNPGVDAVARDLAIAPDGSIIVAGGTFPGNLVLLHYGEDGSRDAEFGHKGNVITHVGQEGGAAEAVAIRPSGRILVAGYGVESRNRWKGVVAAYRADGTLDRRFGSAGTVELTTEKGLTIELKAMHVLASGKILLAGDLAGRVMVVRLHPNGMLDRSFGGGDGQAFADVSGRCVCAYATGMAINRRGRIVVSANTLGKSEPAVLVRFRAGGGLDRGFGRDGVVRTALGTRLLGQDMVVQRNGRIVLVGAYNVPGSGEARAAVVRYRPNGSLDQSFGRSGIFTRDFGHEGVAYSALVQRDGRVMVAGRLNEEPSPFPEDEGASVFDTAELFLIRFLP